MPSRTPASIRLTKLIFTLTLIFACQLVDATQANSGLFSTLLRKADDLAAGAGKQVDNLVPSISDSALIAKRLPDSSDATRLAIVPDESGNWKLVTPDGESQIIDDLGRIDDTVAGIKISPHKDLAGGPPVPMAELVKKIAIRETDFFKLRNKLTHIPPNTELHLIRATGPAYRIKIANILGLDRMVLELGKNTWLNPKNARALDANINYLKKPVNQANLKIGRFETPKTDSKPALTDTIIDLDPDALALSPASYKNRTMIVSGKVKKHAITGKNTLEVRAGGKSRMIDLAQFEKLAEQSRVNLMVIDTGSVTQPGKKWFSKTSIEKRFARTDHAVTQAELLQVLAPKNSKTLIHAGEEARTRVVMSTQYLEPPLTVAEPGTTLFKDYNTGEWLLSAASRATIRSIRINAEDPEHTEEIEDRWLPWVSNIDLLFIIIGLGIFWFVTTVTWKWWKAIWRIFARRPDDQFGKSARIFRGVTFAPFALMLFVPAMLWILIRDWIGFITWPFRKLFARKSA